jgi:hypothetical protein
MPAAPCSAVFRYPRFPIDTAAGIFYTELPFILHPIHNDFVAGQRAQCPLFNLETQGASDGTASQNCYP